MLIVSQSVTTPTDVTLKETATYSQLQAVNKVNLYTHKINCIIIRYSFAIEHPSTNQKEKQKNLIFWCSFRLHKHWIVCF